MGCASLWSEQADEYHLETHATDIGEVIEEDREVGGVRRISELTEY